MEEISFLFAEWDKQAQEISRTHLRADRYGLIETPGAFFGLPWWGPVFVSVAVQRQRVEVARRPTFPMVISPILDEERKIYKIHKSVTGILVDRRKDGSWIVEEQIA